MWVALQHCQRIGVNAWTPGTGCGAGVQARDVSGSQSLYSSVVCEIVENPVAKIIARDDAGNLQAFRAALSLVGEEPEEPVFHNRATDGAAEDVADQFGRLVGKTRRDLRVLIEPVIG